MSLQVKMEPDCCYFYFYYFDVCHCLYINKNQTNNLGFLIEPQRLQIKIVINVLGATLDSVLQFAFEILFSTKDHISLGLLRCAVTARTPADGFSPERQHGPFQALGCTNSCLLAEKTAGTTSSCLPI